jgi:AcrR family transcriptional regulator
MVGMESASLRVYGGVTGDERRAERRAQFIEAGLELLGAQASEPGLTVRAVCRQAGLAARYFYESFADRDALATAVFDHVVSIIADTTLDTVRAAPLQTRPRLRAGLSNIVRVVAEDPRIGRLLFSPALSTPVLVHRRVSSTRMFARLLGGQVQEFYRVEETRQLEMLTEFLVGGFAQALTSWLNGSLELSERELVERCVDIFETVGELTGSQQDCD